MSDEIEKTVKFGPIIGGKTLHFELKFRRIASPLALPKPSKLSYDFSAAIAEVLGLQERSWRIEGLGICRYVPMRVLHEFYDAALLYGAIQRGILPDALGALAAERILVKSLSGLPELMVKYRFYLGIANDDGEYKIVSGKGDNLELIGIQDPYDRLFWLPAYSTGMKIIQKYGKTSIVVEGREHLQVYDDHGRVLPVLGFRYCLSQLIPNKQDQARAFLEAVYTKVRIPEFHSCRLSDNVLFQIDELMAGLIKVMNYLFDEKLAKAWRKRERSPFKIRLFRMAGAHPLPGEKMLVHHEDVLLPLESSGKYW
jgi:hypothetical protein